METQRVCHSCFYSPFVNISQNRLVSPALPLSTLSVPHPLPQIRSRLLPLVVSNSVYPMNGIGGLLPGVLARLKPLSGVWQRCRNKTRTATTRKKRKTTMTMMQRGQPKSKRIIPSPRTTGSRPSLMAGCLIDRRLPPHHNAPVSPWQRIAGVSSANPFLCHSIQAVPQLRLPQITPNLILNMRLKKSWYVPPTVPTCSDSHHTLELCRDEQAIYAEYVT